MARPSEASEGSSLQVRGTVDVEKFKAARALGGNQVRFELRAMKPVQEAQRAVSCIVCIICIICVVCSAQTAERFAIQGLPELKGG